jgi:hypothetical protein
VDNPKFLESEQFHLQQMKDEFRGLARTNMKLGNEQWHRHALLRP